MRHSFYSYIKIYNFFSSAPLLLAAAFVLSLYLHNINELTPPHLIFPLVTVTGFAAIITWIFQIIFKNQSKSMIFSSIFLLVFFSYSTLDKLLKDLSKKIHFPYDPNTSILYIFLIIILFIIFLSLKRSKKNYIIFARYLRLVAFITFIPIVLGIFRFSITFRISRQINSPLDLPKVSSEINTENMPDIYYIVPDSYSAEKVMRDEFKYDNKNFLDFLSQTGFYIAADATSNYPKTFLSLASSLNMEYLDYLFAYSGSSDQTIVTPLIQNNNVLSYLKSIGYKYYQLGSWWSSTKYNRRADKNIILEEKKLINISGLSYIIYESTMIRPVITNYFSHAITGESEKDKRNRIIFQFDQLSQIAKLPGPKFVFVHIIAPHGPYVFDNQCKFPDTEQLNKFSEIENYTRQVECINIKLTHTISSIIANSPQSPVILLQSDEGAPFFGSMVFPSDSWGTAGIDLIQKKFPILSAYYFPEKNYELLYASVTPVNSFRMIFNTFFKTQFPLLEDKNYIFSDMDHLYEFIDISDKISSSKKSG